MIKSRDWKGKYIVAEGIDGSGKGTIIKAIAQWALASDLTVFDLEPFCRLNHRMPTIKEIPEDVIIITEPTFAPIGLTIREELVQSDTYSAEACADAFAIDREMLFKNIIIPGKEQGKLILSERCLASTLVYQPNTGDLDIKALLALEGNKIAIANTPDLLIIAKVLPEVAIKRLLTRTKKDHSKYEKLAFLSKIAPRYESDWLIDFFTTLHTEVIILNTNPPLSVDDVKIKTQKIWMNYLSGEKTPSSL